MLETVEVNPPRPAQYSVIWMHGLGADGHDFEDIIPLLQLPPRCSVRFIFPHAPHRAVTINMGMRMRAWYDILNPVLGSSIEDIDGIDDACARISELIRQENDNGVSTERIVLAGFSQGGAIALHLGLRYPEQLAGILALSTYLPKIAQVEAEARQANRTTPILYLHGLLDPVIPITVAKHSQQVLADLGYQVEVKNYPIPHSLCPEEIHDIGRWLTKLFDSPNLTSLKNTNEMDKV